MWLKNCAKSLICVNDICFDNAAAAGRYVMELSSRGEAVTLTRKLDIGPCLVGNGQKNGP